MLLSVFLVPMWLEAIRSLVISCERGRGGGRKWNIVFNFNDQEKKGRIYCEGCQMASRLMQRQDDNPKQCMLCPQIGAMFRQLRFGKEIILKKLPNPHVYRIAEEFKA